MGHLDLVSIIETANLRNLKMEDGRHIMMHVGEINSGGMMALVVKTGRFDSHVYLKMYLHLCIKIFFVAKKSFEQTRKGTHFMLSILFLLVLWFCRYQRVSGCAEWYCCMVHT